MILSKNAISRMCQKIQTELILFLCVLVMQKHVCTEDEGFLHKAVLHIIPLDVKLMSLKNSCLLPQCSLRVVEAVLLKEYF